LPIFSQSNLLKLIVCSEELTEFVSNATHATMASLQAQANATCDNPPKTNVLVVDDKLREDTGASVPRTPDNASGDD